MKEHIYTIPITEAFAEDCECPLCLCEEKLEREALEYMLGPAMMEPDHRIETNRVGFCTMHYGRMYATGENRLAYALVLDTHLREKLGHLHDRLKKASPGLEKEVAQGFVDNLKGRVSGKKSEADRYAEELITEMDSLLGTCAICTRVERTMERFADTVIYLHGKEPEFKARFESGKGFCMKHFRLLAVVADKTLHGAKKAGFLADLSALVIREAVRVREDVEWFTRMFDYRNRDADWKNSKDAVPRAIRKLTGPVELKS